MLRFALPMLRYFFVKIANIGIPSYLSDDKFVGQMSGKTPKHYFR